MADERRADLPHNIIMEGRRRISISGVLDVLDFNENGINLSTSAGLMSLRGEGLHVEKLSLESGELAVDGVIFGINYSDREATGGFFARLFG